MVCNSLTWTMYGYIFNLPDMILSNLPVGILAIIYALIFMKYSDKQQNIRMLNMLFIFMVSVLYICSLYLYGYVGIIYGTIGNFLSILGSFAPLVIFVYYLMFRKIL